MVLPAFSLLLGCAFGLWFDSTNSTIKEDSNGLPFTLTALGVSIALYILRLAVLGSSCLLSCFLSCCLVFRACAAVVLPSVWFCRVLSACSAACCGGAAVVAAVVAVLVVCMALAVLLSVVAVLLWCCLLVTLVWWFRGCCRLSVGCCSPACCRLSVVGRWFAIPRCGAAVVLWWAVVLGRCRLCVCRTGEPSGAHTWQGSRVLFACLLWCVCPMVGRLLVGCCVVPAAVLLWCCMAGCFADVL